MSALESRIDGLYQEPLDAFVAAQLQTRGLKPSQPADRRTLIRRLSFDLLGLAEAKKRVDGIAVRVSTPDAIHRSSDKAETYALLLGGLGLLGWVGRRQRRAGR